MMNTAKDTISDFIADIRFSQRLIYAGQNVSENRLYMAELKKDVDRMFKARHGFKTDQYGWPICLHNQP